MSVKEERLKLLREHKKFCSECKYRTRDNKLFMRHRRGSKHSLMLGIRNQITMEIDSGENHYTLIVNNVDRDNFNPAQIKFTLKDKTIIGNYSGAVIKEGEPYSYDIHDMLYMRDLTKCEAIDVIENNKGKIEI